MSRASTSAGRSRRRPSPMPVRRWTASTGPTRTPRRPTRPSPRRLSGIRSAARAFRASGAWPTGWPRRSWRPTPATPTWRSSGRPNRMPRQRQRHPDLAETVAIAGERPVLIVPHIGVTKPPGRTVMLCWNGTREAARAATGALPILKQADKVIILLVDPRNDGDRTAGCRRRQMACPARREGGRSTRHRRRFQCRRRDPVARRRP